MRKMIFFRNSGFFLHWFAFVGEIIIWMTLHANFAFLRFYHRIFRFVWIWLLLFCCCCLKEFENCTLARSLKMNIITLYAANEKFTFLTFLETNFQCGWSNNKHSTFNHHVRATYCFIIRLTGNNEHVLVLATHGKPVLLFHSFLTCCASFFFLFLSLL